ncbi:MAG: sugar ABC transporter ATP-binding protein [Bacteroidota bacterium]
MADILLEMKNIKKRFTGTQALAGVDFDVKKGEVHVLLGENGAGKSTLMKILAGSYAPDEGQIYWEGKQVSIKDSSISLALGIGMVYQELTLVKNLSVFENIYLGRLPQKKKLPLIDWKQAFDNAGEILKSLGVEIDIRKPLLQYDLGIQQLVEIARAISKNAKLIILDEPTSALSDNEVENLFKAIGRLKKQGVSFIYITHKLNEVFAIGDRVTVLRDGYTVGSFESLSATNENELIKMMVGRTIEEQYPKEHHCSGEPLFKVEGLSDGKNFTDISFTLHKGEVLGIAGLVGSGRTELAEALFGLRSINNGKVFLNNEQFSSRNPKTSIINRIGYLTKDRKSGLLLHMPVYRNITVSCLKGFSSWGFRRKEKELNTAKEFIEKLKIDTPDIKVNVSNLSGGNQQKVVIAKWLCCKSNIFIMDEPTRGIDVGAKVEVYKLINQITSEGAGVILISSEMPELLGISDRILVMKKGRVVADLNIKDCNQEIIMQKAAGGE